MGGGVVGGRIRATERGKPQRVSPRYYRQQSRDQQHRTTFCASKHARSSYKPTILKDSGFLVEMLLRGLLRTGGMVVFLVEEGC